MKLAVYRRKECEDNPYEQCDMTDQLPECDSNGRYHDDIGRYVALRDYVERIFDEKDKSAEFSRATLEKALVEARVTTDRAMTEARNTVDKALVEAKVAADAVTQVITKRLDNLESGGAPFASRLDDSMNNLKDDVDVLKTNMVKTTVLDALREQSSADLAAVKKQAEADRKSLRRQVLVVGISSGVAVVLAILQLIVKH